MEGIMKAMNERNLNEGQWEDRKQWSLVVGQRRKTFRNPYIYIHPAIDFLHIKPKTYIKSSVPQHVRVYVGRACFITKYIYWITY